VIGEGHKIYNNYIEGINSFKENGSFSNVTGESTYPMVGLILHLMAISKLKMPKSLTILLLIVIMP